MRASVFLTLVIAYAAACVSVANAENVAQIDGTVVSAAASPLDNHTRRLREQKSGEDWWVSDKNYEERAISADKGAGFFFKLKDRLNAKKLVQANNAAHTVDNIDPAKMKELTVATANAVKKNRKLWPRVKKGLKLLYGATLAAFIIVGVQAMLE